VVPRRTLMAPAERVTGICTVVPGTELILRDSA